MFELGAWMTRLSRSSASARAESSAGVVPRAHNPAQHRHQLLRHIPVALQLARADRRLDRRAILRDHALARIAPALMLGALGRAREILEIAIPVGIAVGAGPIHDAPRRVPVARQRRAITTPRVEVREPDHEHQRTREISVVATERRVIDAGQRAGAHLLDDPTGLLVAPRIVALPLQRAHRPQAAFRISGPSIDD
jgi:hypothetical protein